MENLIIEIVKNSVHRCENYEIDLPTNILCLEGMSGHKTRGFLNYIVKALSSVSYKPLRYLEIGSWKGSTFISAFHNNQGDFVSIDNFSQFGGTQEEFTSNVLKYNASQNIRFFNCDCFKMNLEIDTMQKKFSIYFYDGNHYEKDHLQALRYYLSVMEDTFVYIVDDWNEEIIRDATRQDLRTLPIEIIYEHEVITNDTNEYGWWNGIGIFVIRKIFQ